MLQEHIVPQEITKYEFKIFAGLTWKQFIVVGGGAATSYFLYLMVSKNIMSAYVGYPLAIITFLVPVTLLFMRVEKEPLAVILTRFLSYTSIPLLRVWLWGKQKVVPYKQRLRAKPGIFPTYLKDYFETEFHLTTKQVIRKLSKRNKPAFIPIDDKYLTAYADFSIKIPAIPNTLAIKVSGPKKNPQPGITVVIKNKHGMPLYIGKTNNYGIVYFSNPLPSDKYFIEIKHDNIKYPIYQIKLEGKSLPLIELLPKVSYKT